MPIDGGPRRVSLVGPIVLITIGVLLLLHNWRPEFDPWSVLWEYWPLILIFVGLGMIFDNVQRSRNPGPSSRISVGSTIGVVAFVLVLALLIWHGRGRSRSRGFSTAPSHTAQTIDLQEAKSVRAKVSMPSGELTIAGGSKRALDADFNFSGNFDPPRVDYHVAGGVGQIDISQESHPMHFGNSRNDWNLHFSEALPLELRVEMGAGQGNLNFRGIPLTRLDLELGAGEANVDLTGDRKADLTADIEGGVGQANIRLPRNIGVIAEASGGIGSIRTPGLKKEGSSYINEVYGKTPATIRLRVTGGIGEIDLIEEP